MTTDSPHRFVVSVLGFFALTVLLVGCGSSDVVVKGPLTRGNERYDDGDLHGAAEEYLAALDRDPADVRARYNLALVHHDLFKASAPDAEVAKSWRDRAEAGYRQVLVDDPGNARAVTAMAVLLADEGRHDEALAWLAATPIVDDTGRALPEWTRGALLAARGDAAGAEAAWRAALAADPNHHDSVAALTSHLLDAGRIDEADAILTEALEVHAFSFTLRKLHARAAVLSARAATADVDAAWHEAIGRLNWADALIDARPDVNEWLSEAHAARGDVEAAVRHLWTARDSASDAALAASGVDPAAWRRDVEARLAALYQRLAAPR